MCGILGQFIKKNSVISNYEDFSNALDLLKHRGPDCSGIYQNKNILLGHRRLSIIDIKDHSKQPMISNDGNVVLIFNGEIYNYKELREDLLTKKYVFRTDSDTEVLLQCYIEYGIECINLFNGMFSFIIYDRNNDVSYIVRDRLGIKPLYYYNDNDRLIISSEIKSILQLNKQKPSLNINAVSSYFSFRYPILDDTFFKNIFSLPPANYLKYKNNEIHQIEYWNLKKSFKKQKIDKGEEYYITELKKLLKSSVSYRMISDVPLGAFLSGGVDSSIITYLMNENTKEKVKTFTIGFKESGYNEFEYANIIVNQCNTNHKEILVSGEDYIETMEYLIEFKDAPLSVPNEVPLFLMSKELKKYITVVLSGEGADELFGGYGRIFRSPYDYQRIKDIEKLNLNDAQKKLFIQKFYEKYLTYSFNNEIDHFINIYSYTSDIEKEKLLNDSIDLEKIKKKLIKKFMYYFDELDNDSYYNKMMYAFEKIHLVGLLHRVDMTTMATSVEARVPFVDHRLVEFAFTIPVKYKLKWDMNISLEESIVLMSDEISEVYDIPKYILKKAYEDEIDHDVLYRKKMGFPVPLNNWFGGQFKQYAYDILLSEEARKRNLYNISNIEKDLRDEKISDHSFAMKIWMLINLELFCRKYFD